MLKSVKNHLLLLIIFELVSKTACLFSKNFLLKNAYSTRLQSVKPPDWENSDDSSLNRDSSIKITQDFIQVMDTEIGSMVSSLTIDTVTYYMLEFRNDVIQRWMVNFSNYSTNGFGPNNEWTDYIEKMIKSSDEKIQVIMKPPQNIIRGNMGPNTAIQYDFDVEPRKIANQILTVRENLCEEIIHDLHSVAFENEEAMRYATSLVQDGLEKAEKGRKMTRMSSQAGSTPNRDRNFNDIDIYLTDITLKLIIDDYIAKTKNINHKSSSSTSSLNTPTTGSTLIEQFLDEFSVQMHANDSTKSVSQKFFEKSFSTRTFLEQLFYKGITEGSSGTQVGDNTINVLKLVKSIADTRAALAMHAQGILRMQNSNNRKYYKMIKDYGGILSLRQSGKKTDTAIQNT